jgi:antitoxin MazE
MAFMRAKISKWGNSLAVRLPKGTAEAAGFASGQEVELSAKDGVVELRSARRRYTVEELFAEAEKQGPLVQPPLVDWGPDVGAEVIDDEYLRGTISLEDLLKGPDGSKGR